MCTVRSRHKDKIARCGFFVVPENGPALLRMPDIEFLDILKIMFKVVEGKQADRKFDSQTMKASSAPNCKANTNWERTSDKADGISTSSNMPDYVRSSMDREADKKANQYNTKNSK